MFAISIFQLVAQRRRENLVRRPAYSGEPIERHMRLNEDQFDHLVDYFHGWRTNCHQGNEEIRVATSEKRIKIVWLAFSLPFFSSTLLALTNVQDFPCACTAVAYLGQFH